VPSEVHREDLARVSDALADANQETANAVFRAARLIDTQHPAMDLKNTQGPLLAAAAAIADALDTVEHTLDDIDPDYGQPTPRRIVSEHADRLKEQYDGPVKFVALQLLERNRREWLHRKPDTIGAEEVRRHGLTENQRSWLNGLQGAWDDAE